MHEAAGWDWEEINFFSVTFQHFKSIYGPLSFEGIIALKLIKTVGSKAVPETFEEFASECSVAIANRLPGHPLDSRKF